MAVFRIDKTRDYTVMSNHHFRNTSLSLKAKGLLSLMLSLPENWDYTLKGLARICRDGVDSISAGVRELEQNGYLIRERIRNPNGQLGAITYTILEQPRDADPESASPTQEKPIWEIPTLESPMLENPAQLNNNILNTDLSNTYKSNPILSNPPTPNEEQIGMDEMEAREIYRDIILENIDYEILSDDPQIDREQLDEIVAIILDTVCTSRKTVRIAGDDFPAEVVRSRFLKLNASHIRYVMACLKENTTRVRNIKKYLQAALYNATFTMESYYAALVQHEMVNNQ
ncbi:MAG: helix-turn-helix domain-containing protein [Oscillospiraceae bacterium]|nr:helix-turn-helix domain-containing protein [Oscillospiraceae bacterium]